MKLNELGKIAETFKHTEKMPVLFLGHGSPMNAIEENNMTTTMRFPIIRSQLIGSISALQSTSQQAGGIDMSNILSLIMPVMIVGMMTKMTANLGRSKQVKTGANPQSKNASESGS